jgi:hypothetical protein
MKQLRVPLIAFLLLVTAGCSYGSVRMYERAKCDAMPTSQSESCFDKTRMTKEEYDMERRKLAASKSSGGEGEKPVDPRYQEWLP